MNRMLRAIALLSALAMAGCVSAGSGVDRLASTVSAITVGIENPVSREALAGAEAAVVTARSGALAYLGLPVCVYDTTAGLQNACSAPRVRRQIKLYDRKVQAALVTARRFVRDNPTVNAASVIAVIYQAIDGLNAAKAANGI